jgi:hypothetical protein
VLGRAGESRGIGGESRGRGGESRGRGGESRGRGGESRGRGGGKERTAEAAEAAEGRATTNLPFSPLFSYLLFSEVVAVLRLGDLPEAEDVDLSLRFFFLKG